MNKSILKVILVAIPLLASVPAMAQMDNAFQSTSTMAGSGSAYASDPTIGSNGMVEQPAATPNRGRTAFTPGEGKEEDHQVDDTPIGSALPALLLLAGAYAGVVAVKRRLQQA